MRRLERILRVPFREPACALRVRRDQADLWGAVSARGVIPLSWSLDHVGPLAATVSDAAVVLQAIAGYDALDVCSADVPVSDYVSGLSAGTKTLRGEFPRAYFYDDLDDEVRVAVEKALAVIETLVACARDVQVEVSSDRTVQAADIFAYHAEHVARTPELYQPETLRPPFDRGRTFRAAEYIQQRREMDVETTARSRNVPPTWICSSRLRLPIPAPAIGPI